MIGTLFGIFIAYLLIAFIYGSIAGALGWLMTLAGAPVWVIYVAIGVGCVAALIQLLGNLSRAAQIEQRRRNRW